jgi:DtxR family Mn-dependent transcriptional regulator
MTHTPYKGVRLTKKGGGIAANVLRRQRLWECFLHEQLKIDWRRLYELTCELEHATASQVTEALAVFLGEPRHCPHGNPIPDRDGNFEPLDGIPLSALEIGQEAVVLAIQEGSVEVLEHIEQHGLLPHEHVTVLDAAPLQGPLTLRIGSRTVALGLRIAGLVLVRKIETETGEKAAAIRLDQLRPGERAIIKHVGGQAALRRRLAEMGILAGEVIVAERVAPLGDPAAYLIKGYHLSLRNREAAQIQVKIEAASRAAAEADRADADAAAPSAGGD